LRKKYHRAVNDLFDPGSRNEIGVQRGEHRRKSPKQTPLGSDQRAPGLLLPPALQEEKEGETQESHEAFGLGKPRAQPRERARRDQARRAPRLKRHGQSSYCAKSAKPCVAAVEMGAEWEGQQQKRWQKSRCAAH